MIFKYHIPLPPLNHFVECIIYHSDYSPLHAREKLLPDGMVNLIIDLTDIPKNLYDNDNPLQKTSFRRGWLSGIHQEYLTIDAGQNSAMVVASFKPGKSSAFWDFPMNEIAHQVVELEAIWGNRFLQLREQMLAAQLPEERISILEHFLLEIAGERLECHPCIAYAVDAIQTRCDSTIIRDLKQKVGYSHKHFIHLFEKHVGVKPKQFLRVIKFQGVIQRIEQRQAINWAQIAHDCGYYDQAHFIKEFRKFSGMNPTVYLSSKGPFVNYLPID